MDHETVQISALVHAFEPDIPLQHIAQVFCGSYGDVHKAWGVLQEQLTSNDDVIGPNNATPDDMVEVNVEETPNEWMMQSREFMNYMFGDDKNQVISDVLDNCNYDIDESMARLINLCQDNPAKAKVHYEAGHWESDRKCHLEKMKLSYEEAVQASMENDSKKVNNFLKQGKDYMVQLSAGNIIIPRQDQKAELILDVCGISQPAINPKLLKNHLKKLNNEQNDCLKVVFGTDGAAQVRSGSKERKVRSVVSLQSYTIEDGNPGEIIIRRK